MGSRLTKKAKEFHYHTWHDNHECGVYLYRNYKMCYITICRFMPGEKDPITNETFTKISFIPTINGARINDRGGGVRTDAQYSFESLDEAKTGAMKQIDRNVEFSKEVRYVRIKNEN